MEATNPGAGWIPIVVVGVIDQFGQGQKETEVIVNFSRWAKFLQIAQYFHHFFHSGIDICNETCFRLDAKQLDVFLTEYQVVEGTGFKRRQTFQRLDEFCDVIPLAVEDELAQKKDVVGVDAINHPRLAFQTQLKKTKKNRKVKFSVAQFSKLHTHLADVKLPTADEFQDEANHVVLT